MTRVLFVASSSVRGGAQVSLIRLISKLDKARFTSVLYCPEGFLSQEARRRGITVHSADFNVFAVARLARFIRKNSFDVVNTSLLGTAVTAALSIALNVVRPKLVVTVNNSIFYPGLSPFRKLVICLAYFLLNLSNATFFAKSNSIRAELTSFFKVHPYRIHRIGNPIDLQRLPPEDDRESARSALGIAGADIAIGVVGSMFPLKGHFFMIEAVPFILAKFPNVSFYFIGDGPLRTKLETIACQVPGQPIKFLGEREDNLRCISAMDIVAVPSLSEGLPNVMLEAMGMSKPVVASSVGGCLDVIRSGENAILVQAGNARSLARGILWMLENPEEAIKMGQRGAETIRRFYGAGKVAEEIGAILEQASGKIKNVSQSKRPDPTILLLVSSAEIGGAQTHLIWLSMYLRASGINVVVVCPPGPLHDQLIHNDIEAYVLRLGLSSIIRLASIMRAKCPTVVHAHLLGSALYGAIAGLLAGIPKMVWTAHNPVVYPGIPLWKQYGHIGLLRLLTARINRFIAVSHDIGRSLLDLGIASSDKLKVIHNGVSFSCLEKAASTTRDWRRELGIPADFPVVGAIGRLSFAKGHDILIEAFNSIRDEFPNLHCVLVGEGEKRAELERLVCKLDVRERVHFVGFQPDVLSWYRGMDMVTFPSRFEGLPLGVVEAAYAGKPIVATNVGGIKEILENEVSALLIPPEDPMCLANGIRKLLDNPSLALGLGRHAQCFVMNKWSIEKCGQETVGLYNEVQNLQ